VLKLTDRADYALAGLTERAIPRSLPPGRAVRAADGVEIQLAHLGGDPSPVERNTVLARAVSRWSEAGTGARPLIRVRALPDRVRLADLRATASTASPSDGIVLGAGGDAGDAVVIDLFAGARRLLVAGPTRSGRSTVLCSVLRQAAAEGWQVIAAAPARSVLGACAAEAGGRLVTPGCPGVGPPPGVRSVLLVDDSEQFLDTGVGEQLTEWTRADTPELAVVAAGVSDELAVTFRGVAAEVRRARCTVLLRPGPGDADLAGCPLPRRRSSGPPGRGLLVGDPAWGNEFAAGPLPIQIALP
jgi:S-DNA-T family DNA segregation ATPase FtsK/SpoIIIE